MNVIVLLLWTIHTVTAPCPCRAPCILHGIVEQLSKPRIISEQHLQVDVLLHLQVTSYSGLKAWDSTDISVDKLSYKLGVKHSTDKFPHQMTRVNHSHHLRRVNRHHPALHIVFLFSRDQFFNETHLDLKITSIKHRSCFRRIPVEHARTSLRFMCRDLSFLCDNNDSSLLNNSSVLKCGLPFSVNHTVVYDPFGHPMIYFQAYLSTAPEDMVAIFAVFSQCTCDECVIPTKEAESLRFPFCEAPSNCTREELTVHGSLGLRVAEFQCIGVEVCGLEKWEHAHQVATITSFSMDRIIEIKLPHRALGFFIRTYIGYGILGTTFLVFGLCSIVNKCGSSTGSIMRSKGNSDTFELSSQRLKIRYERRLALGDISSVYLGLLSYQRAIHDKLALREYRTVAVKVLHQLSNSNMREQFLEEVRIHKQLTGHQRIVELIGVITIVDPPCIVTQLYAHGTLLRFLRERRIYMSRMQSLGVDPATCPSVDLDHFLSMPEIFRMAIQVAAGLEFMHSRGFVHRNLCAKNIMVDDRRSLRIGDFSMSGHEGDTFKSAYSTLPVKRMAPESLRYLIFTAKSDVWSFGVLLFELITLGAAPYPTIHPAHIHAYLLKGNRLTKPKYCSHQLYSIMQSTWQYLPANRPSVEDLRQVLATMAIQDGEDPATPYYIKVDMENEFCPDDGLEAAKSLPVIIEEDSDMIKSG